MLHFDAGVIELFSRVRLFFLRPSTLGLFGVPFFSFFFLSDMKVLGVPQSQIEKRFSMLQPSPPNPTGRRRVARGRSVFEKVLGGLENAS